MIREMWRRILSQSDGKDEVETPKDQTFTFLLRYKNLDVGVLSLDQGRWTFKYTDEFRAQSEIEPLVGFSDAHRTYSSRELWCFFSVRIPSLDQPAIEKAIRNERLDRTNSAELLKRFGERTIANPFVLEVANSRQQPHMG